MPVPRAISNGLSHPGERADRHSRGKLGDGNRDRSEKARSRERPRRTVYPVRQPDPAERRDARIPRADGRHGCRFHGRSRTAFPILVNGRIVIPVGSWVMGTVTEVKKPGRVKGRGELYIRFDNLTLPNGVTREFRSRMGGMDAGSTGELDRAEGKVKSEGNKAGDVRTVAETTSAGASVGAIAGNAAGHGAMGLGIGAAAGAAGGLIYILASRGPDAIDRKSTRLNSSHLV